MKQQTAPLLLCSLLSRHTRFELRMTLESMLITLPDGMWQRLQRRWRLARLARSGPRGRAEASLHSQTPSSAAVLLNQASVTAELGESTVRQEESPTHPWRNPLLKLKRTKSLDNNTGRNPLQAVALISTGNEPHFSSWSRFATTAVQPV